MTSWCLWYRIEMRPLTRPRVCSSSSNPGTPDSSGEIKTCRSGLRDDKLSPEWVIRRLGSLCSLSQSRICKRQSRRRTGKMPWWGWGPGVAAACRLIRGRTWLAMKQRRLQSWNSLAWWGRGVRLFQGMRLWHVITVEISFFQRRLK